MVRLTFKQFINESNVIPGPLNFSFDTKTKEGKLKELQALANFPQEIDTAEVSLKKSEPEQFDVKNIEKPVASGGSAKEEAIRKSKVKRDNTHFGPSQFYVVPARLKTPSVTISER